MARSPQNKMGYGQAAFLLLVLCYADADLKMTGPSTYTATLGSDAHIPCTFTSDEDLRDSVIIWYYKDSVILRTGDSAGYNTSKYYMDKDQALNGTANLRISNISVADGGIYKCSVSYAQLRQQTITVTIQAAPKITVVNDLVMINKTSFLCCEISGFYPEDINITWLRDGVPLGNVLEGKLQNNPDGTYSINSSIILRLTEEDRKRNFSCRVQHVSLIKPLDKDLQLIYGDEKMSNDFDYKVETIILGCSCGLLALAIIIICCLWWKQIQDATRTARNDRTNEGGGNDPQSGQNDAEEREDLNQGQISTPRRRPTRQQDTGL